MADREGKVLGGGLGQSEGGEEGRDQQESNLHDGGGGRLTLAVIVCSLV